VPASVTISRLVVPPDACSTWTARELVCCVAPQGSLGYLLRSAAPPAPAATVTPPGPLPGAREWWAPCGIPVMVFPAAAGVGIPEGGGGNANQRERRWLGRPRSAGRLARMLCGRREGGREGRASVGGLRYLASGEGSLTSEKNGGLG
jgi:hypothetical protein